MSVKLTELLFLTDVLLFSSTSGVIHAQGPKKEINDSPLPRSMSMEKLVPMRKFEITYVTVNMSEEH